MQPQELRTLKILEAVDQEESPSQRELARRLNISLGLVNSFIKRLVNKGYFKVTTIPKNRVKYMLTPKGMAEKTRLTYEYIQYSIGFYRNSRNRLIQTFKALERKGVHTIVFYGANDFAEIGYLSLKETRISLKAVCDNRNTGGRFFEFTILKPEELLDLQFDCIVNMKIEHHLEYDREMKKLGLEKNGIMIV